MASKRVLISQQVTRNLGDRSDEKRKQAALEIEQFVKSLGAPSAATQERVNTVISTLVSDFLLSYQPNMRKGGLIGLSAVTIALLDSAGSYLTRLLPPVLRCFLDQEPRVRYYACEALYNIAKVVRGQLLLFFNEVFDGLCKLCADSDADVRAAAALLDRLVKDIVTESAAFDLERFVPLLRERVRLRSPLIRQLILGWIALLDALPDVDLLEFLPEYLGGLFDMLSDPAKEVRQQSYSTLAVLLRQIVHSPRVDLGSLVPILTVQAGLRDNFRRLTVLTWVREFVHLGKGAVLPFLPDLLAAAMLCMGDPAREIRAKAQQCNDALLALVVDTSAAANSAANSAAAAATTTAAGENTDANNNPENATGATVSASAGNSAALPAVDLGRIVGTVTGELSSPWLPARLSALRWTAMLLAQHPRALFAHLHTLFPALLSTLQDADEQVVRLALEVLARLALDADGTLHPASLDLLLSNILRLCASDVAFLEARGGLVLRQLSLLLDARAVFTRLAELLARNGDVEFTALMAQTLGLLLLSATELHGLRSEVRASLRSAAGRSLFATLFTTWAHAPVAALALALLAEGYELAAWLVAELARGEATVGALLQLDRLVQLLESPIFVRTRLHLLDPVRRPALHRALYGVLTLLPQSAAFASLKERLQSVAPYVALTASLSAANVNATSSAASLNSKSAKGKSTAATAEDDDDDDGDETEDDGDAPVPPLPRDMEKALKETFRRVQIQHQEKRRRVAAFASLMGDADGDLLGDEAADGEDEQGADGEGDLEDVTTGDGNNNEAEEVAK